ncbi:sortase [Lacticaseibacillus chiayiensis]|nr:sortase [Lacticaseibacillus chiayiensis]
MVAAVKTATVKQTAASATKQPAATSTQVSSAPAAPAKESTSAPAASTTTTATKAPATAAKVSTPTATSSSIRVDLLNSTAALQPAIQSVAHPSWSVASGVVASQPAASTAVKASTPAPAAASSAPVASTPAPVAKPAATPSATQASAPAPVQQAKPAPTPTPVATPAQPVKPQVEPAPTYASRVLMFAGVTVPYIIGNESMDAAPANGAATWGGQANYSNNSGENTHFIGHNPGAFAAMLSLGIGSPITVTDAAGQARTYHVYRLATVNPNAVTADGQDLWNDITGTGGGQRITLQTCVGDYWRLIAFAR